MSKSIQTSFDTISSELFKKKASSQEVVTSLYAEDSTYTRINGSKVRQSGFLQNIMLDVRLFEGKRSLSSSLVLSGHSDVDTKKACEVLEKLQGSISSIPDNPYCAFPAEGLSSSVVEKGNLLAHKDVYETLLAPARSADMTGLYTSGMIYQGMQSSSGCNHWYETPSFIVDFSIMGKKKRTATLMYAGQAFNTKDYTAEIERCLSVSRLQDELEEEKLTPGTYRAYLAPEAVSALLGMFSYNCISERAIREKRSPLTACREKGKKFSPLFSLSDSHTKAKTSGYNQLGYLLDKKLSMIEKGVLTQSMVSEETAIEFGIESNHASQGECMRAPVMDTGNLEEKDILSELDSGLYISNVHYLNWSDPFSGRVTGLNRHSCFLIENGQHKACMPTMRFDDTLFSMFGEALEAVGSSASFLPFNGSYDARSSGGKSCPGILLSGFEITL